MSNLNEHYSTTRLSQSSKIEVHAGETFLANRSYFRWEISSRVFSGVPETSSFHILLITALKTILFDVNAD